MEPQTAGRCHSPGRPARAEWASGGRRPVSSALGAGEFVESRAPDRGRLTGGTDGLWGQKDDPDTSNAKHCSELELTAPAQRHENRRTIPCPGGSSWGPGQCASGPAARRSSGCRRRGPWPCGGRRGPGTAAPTPCLGEVPARVHHVAAVGSGVSSTMWLWTPQARTRPLPLAPAQSGGSGRWREAHPDCSALSPPQYDEHVISPKEFVHLAGKSTLKDWKRAIRMNGIMLRWASGGGCRRVQAGAVPDAPPWRGWWALLFPGLVCERDARLRCEESPHCPQGCPSPVPCHTGCGAHLESRAGGGECRRSSAEHPAGLSRPSPRCVRERRSVARGGSLAGGPLCSRRCGSPPGSALLHGLSQRPLPELPGCGLARMAFRPLLA